MQVVREYQIPPWVAVLALQTMNWLMNTYDLISLYLNKTEAGFKYAFFTRWYTFFEGNPTPYLENELAKTSLISAAPEWYYSPDEMLFVQSGLEELKGYAAKDLTTRQKRHIPFLSADIQEGDAVHYDLTDFVEQVRWVARSPSSGPTVSQLVAAWSIHSGVIPDTRRNFTLHWINTSGEVNECSITDSTSILDCKGPTKVGPAKADLNTITDRKAPMTFGKTSCLPIPDVVAANENAYDSSGCNASMTIDCATFTASRASQEEANQPVMEGAPLSVAYDTIVPGESNQIDPALALLAQPAAVPPTPTEATAPTEASAPAEAETHLEEALSSDVEGAEVIPQRPPPRTVARHRRRGTAPRRTA